jgi:hypothetical protein
MTVQVRVDEVRDDLAQVQKSISKLDKSVGPSGAPGAVIAPSGFPTSISARAAATIAC